ncbi:MAG TPA: CAP domain-containing protein [Solirubrobacteraceae bacterium]|jgi:uncharacterized protein YkwD
MSPGAGVDTGHVARLRLILLLALLALPACALAGISSAQGARQRVQGSPAAGASIAVAGKRSRPRRRNRRPARCARTVSYHAGKRPVVHHAHRRCRSGARRRSRTPSHTRRGHRNRPHRGSSRPLPSGPAGTGRRTSAADVGGQCTDTQLTPSAADVEQVRAAVLCLVNRERAAHGESALALNAALQRAAQSHTESMAWGDYFEHVGPGGDTPVSRLRSAGYLTGSGGFEVGENIAWGTLWLGTPRAIVAAWMASPGHRANILDARFRDTAVGVSPHPPASLSHGQAGGVYTQDFAVLSGR